MREHGWAGVLVLSSTDGEAVKNTSTTKCSGATTQSEVNCHSQGYPAVLRRTCVTPLPHHKKYRPKRLAMQYRSATLSLSVDYLLIVLGVFYGNRSFGRILALALRAAS